jgi:hypothetical protein
MDTADNRSAAGAPSPQALSIALRSVYQVGDFLLLCHAARADNRYEHWISPLAADKAADKPADAEEGHGPNSPCLSVWKNRWVSRRGRQPRAPADRTAPRLCGEPDGDESPGALLKGLIFFGLAYGEQRATIPVRQRARLHNAHRKPAYLQVFYT